MCLSLISSIYIAVHLLSLFSQDLMCSWLYQPCCPAAIEGWVIFVTGIHEEARDEDLHEQFAEFGDIKNLCLNLDRQTGFVKGYALIEYTEREQAEAAVRQMNDQEILGQAIKVDFAFSNNPLSRRHRR
eukprot:evm.model.scf_3924.1 EVM.evm.TU.scf_3924.1   scf_3924:6864-7582(-)